MDLLALTVSVFALMASGYSLYLQRKDSTINEKTFDKENRISLGFNILPGRYHEYTDYDQITGEVSDYFFLTVDYSIFNKGINRISIEKVSIIFKDLGTGNLITNVSHDFSKSAVFIEAGADPLKRQARINFKTKEKINLFNGASVLLKVEFDGIEPKFSQVQKLIIHNASEE